MAARVVLFLEYLLGLFEVAARTLLMPFTTVLDVPILQVAGHDIAVNPDSPVGTR